MKPRLLLILFSCLGLCLPAAGQKVKLINSTVLHWSGGVAGKRGVNYTFTLEFSGYKQGEPVPDTVWIGDNCIPVVLKDSAVRRNFNTIRTVGKQKITYFFTVGTSGDDYAMHMPTSLEEKITKPVPPILYKGLALISYRYNDVQKYFVVNKIMTQYPAVNYP